MLKFFGTSTQNQVAVGKSQERASKPWCTGGNREETQTTWGNKATISQRRKGRAKLKKIEQRLTLSCHGRCACESSLLQCNEHHPTSNCLASCLLSSTSVYASIAVDSRPDNAGSWHVPTLFVAYRLACAPDPSMIAMMINYKYQNSKEWD